MTAALTKDELERVKNIRRWIELAASQGLDCMSLSIYELRLVFQAIDFYQQSTQALLDATEVIGKRIMGESEPPDPSD